MTKRSLRSLLLAVSTFAVLLSPLSAADLSITATSVFSSGLPGCTYEIRKVATSVTVTAGQTIALDTSTNTYKLADADTLAVSVVRGIAMHGAAAGQDLKICRSDPKFKVGATLVIGDTVWQSANAGGMTKVASEGVATASYVTCLGVAVSTTELNLNLTAAGAVRP